MHWSICLDVNIILDVLLKREEFFEQSYRVMQDLQNWKIKGYLSAHHIDTLAYIIQKNTHSKEKTRYILQSLCTGLSIISVDEKIIKNALDNTTIQDIEDAILYHACISSNIWTIVTRNIKDFPISNTHLSVMTPETYILSL